MSISTLTLRLWLNKTKWFANCLFNKIWQGKAWSASQESAVINTLQSTLETDRISFTVPKMWTADWHGILVQTDNAGMSAWCPLHTQSLEHWNTSLNLRSSKVATARLGSVLTAVKPLLTASCNAAFICNKPTSSSLACGFNHSKATTGIMTNMQAWSMSNF